MRANGVVAKRAFSLATVTSKPVPAKRHKNGYAVNQCLVPAKMGVLVERTHGAYATARPIAQRRSVWRGSRIGRAAVRDTRACRRPANRLVAPMKKSTRVIVGTVAAVITHAYVRGIGGFQYVTPKYSML